MRLTLGWNILVFKSTARFCDSVWGQRNEMRQQWKQKTYSAIKILKGVSQLIFGNLKGGFMA